MVNILKVGEIIILLVFHIYFVQTRERSPLNTHPLNTHHTSRIYNLMLK